MKDKPVLTPLQELFSSRKFILAVATIVLNVLVLASPELAKHAEQLSLIITSAFGLLFLHLSAEDLIKLRQSAPGSQQAASSDLVAEIARVATEILAKPAGQNVIVNTGAQEPIGATLDTAKG